MMTQASIRRWHGPDALGAPDSSESSGAVRGGRGLPTGLVWADYYVSEAESAEEPRERLRAAYLAALKGAGALIEVRRARLPRRPRTRSAWVLLRRVAPEYTEWIEELSAYGPCAVSAEQGSRLSVSENGSREVLQRVIEFLAAIERDVLVPPAVAS